MKNFTFLVSLIICNSFFAQKSKDQVLFTINETPVMVSEFKRVYEKNLDLVDDEAKDIDKNLEMFINYKLKVNEAYDLKLDTVKTFKKEFFKYKKQLIAPYLKDKDFEQKQLEQAYERTKQEVKASHILVAFPKGKKKIDTLAMISKLNDLKTKIESGESFSSVANQFSEDPSAKSNGGDLGYFSAFRMVMPFEENAYTTEVGKISNPFKTRFGYHILKVFDKRKSIGEFSAAHILLKKNNTAGKSIIDEVYTKLEKGADFKELAKQYSEDTGSKGKGGVLGKFGAGRMVPSFENEVLNLKEGNYSKPFETRYGWHIVKLLKKHPVGSFEDLKPSLKSKINRSGIGKLSQKKVVEKLKKKYNVIENDESLNSLLKEPASIDNNISLFNIKNEQKTVGDFKEFCKKNRKILSKFFYNLFLDREVTEYFKKDLEKNDEDFKYTLNEYKDGILLFDLMQSKIWNKSSKDSLGIKNYYDTNIATYKSKSLASIKGKVISDYQKHLEDEWIKQLHSTNAIEIRKKTLKKFKSKYKNK